MSKDSYATITKIASDVRTCMITSTGEDGNPRSRPMATQTVEFDGDAWFFAGQDSSLVADVAANPLVNVSYSGSSSWLSLTGSAEVVRDETKKAQLWNEFVEAWFPEGKTDPSVVLVKVNALSAEYWDTPGGKVTALLEMTRARITGEKPDPGSNETVDLR